MIRTPIAGLTPPETAEVRVREVFPSVARSPGIASLGRALTRTIVLAPLAWLLMSAVYFGKLLFNLILLSALQLMLTPLFLVLVGSTSLGRKGTSWGHPERLMEVLDGDPYRA